MTTVKAASVRSYTFGFDFALPDRLATDDEVDVALPDKGEISVSDHIMALVDAEQDKWPQLDFKTAVERVRKRELKLFTIYASESGGRLRIY